jgi:hypothetical protein
MYTPSPSALAHPRAYKERGNEAYALLISEIAAHRNPPDAA